MNQDFAQIVESGLRNASIPVSQITQLTPGKISISIASKESAKQEKEDFMLYADAFHCAKWHIKAKAYANNYEVGFLPQCPGGSNALKLRVPGSLPETGEAVRDKLLRSRLQLYFPSLNSLRRLSENSKDLLEG